MTQNNEDDNRTAQPIREQAAKDTFNEKAEVMTLLE